MPLDERRQTPKLSAEDQIGQWAAGLTWETVPDAPRTAARRCVLDAISVGLAGTCSPAYEAAAAAIRSLGETSGPCTVLGSHARRSPTQAAWLNGTAIHAWDFDDTSYAGIVHATTCVLPAALAAAQATGGTIRDVMTAYLAGVETELALGCALGNGLYSRGHWSTTALGVPGAAVAAARGLNLPASRIAQALRIALNLSMGMRSAHGTSAKPYLCGFASKSGVEAAWAAASGVSAGSSTLAGKFGYADIANGGRLDAQAFESLGRTFRIVEPGMALKLYPACSATQAAVQALLELRASHGFTAADILRIHVHGTPLVKACLAYEAPETPTQAQFSMQFAIATATLQGTFSIDHLNEDWIRSEAVQSLCNRIVLLQDDELVAGADLKRHPEASRVTVVLSNGMQLERTVRSARGMPDCPLADEEITGKFVACAGRIHTPEAARALFDRLSSADEGADARLAFDTAPQTQRNDLVHS